MDRFGELKVFVRVVEDGSFSAAGRSLSLTPSTVSKLIGRMEDRLGVMLFRRSARTASLTPEGTTFHEAALRALEALEATETALFAGRVAPDTLRVRSMPSFAVSQLAPVIPAFLDLHPELRLEVLLTMEPGNLLEHGIDVAIHVGPLEDSSLVAHRFASTRWLMCAAPSYLAARGVPGSPADLAHHDCLSFLPDIPARAWAVRGPGAKVLPLRMRGHIMSNHGEMLLELARRGAGIVQLCEFQVAGDLRAGTLVEVLPEHNTGDRDPISAVYRSRRHLSPRIRVFLDFLTATFSRSADWRPRDEEVRPHAVAV
jgi:DNA-binding transcriptional LysR family regulator